ncbi:MAG: FHA domain-containing protein [Nitrospiraceae bacterium]|nr:FHA domain-containing protein [Nitrospiraceae bacterium]
MTYQLVAISGRHKGSSWSLHKAGLTLGRDAACDIVLPDPIVSRRHCRLVPEGDGIRLEDLQSRNPAFLNGVPTERAELRPGDELALGSWRFILTCVTGQAPRLTAGHGLTQTWSWEKGEPVVLEVGTAQPPTEPHPNTIEDLTALFRAGRELGGCSATPQLTATLVRHLSERFKPRRLWFALVHRDEPAVFCEGEGLTHEAGASPALLRAIRRALHEKRGLLTGQAAAGHGLHQKDKRLTFTLVCPVTLAGVNVALIALETEVPHGAYDEEDLRFLVLLSQSLAPAVCAAQTMERLRRDNERLKDRAGESSELVGKSKAIRHVRGQIAKAARSDLSVLVTGETGVGKELVARLIHLQSDRNARPFVTVNCAAIPRELFESQIFGYEKGAFTGAESSFAGLMSEAHSGTLFLDEIGDLSSDNQARILRAIELGTFRRIGAEKDTRVDIRIIAATNQDIQAAIPAGAFRRDLYHRLNAFEIHVPPLSERPSDIPILAQHFLDTNRDHAKHPITGFSTEATADLRERPWPGNVRELRNCVMRAIATVRTATIQRDDIYCPSVVSSALHNDERGLLPLAEVEKRHIASVLRQCEGNVSAAARVLQISRTTLYKRMAEYGI